MLSSALVANTRVLLKPRLTSFQFAGYQLGCFPGESSPTVLRHALQKDWQASLVGVHGAVALSIEHAGDVQLARPEIGAGDGHQLVAAVYQRRDEAGLAIENGIVRHVAERKGHELIDEIRVT